MCTGWHTLVVDIVNHEKREVVLQLSGDGAELVHGRCKDRVRLPMSLPMTGKLRTSKPCG